MSGKIVHVLMIFGKFLCANDKADDKQHKSKRTLTYMGHFEMTMYTSNAQCFNKVVCLDLLDLLCIFSQVSCITGFPLDAL